MNAATSSAPIPRAVLFAWLICGTMDITAACIEAWFAFDWTPLKLLQTVAGALLGPATYNGGLATAAMGLAMHFTVALGWTTLFFVLSRRFPILLKHAVPAGLLYGAFVFFAMYRGVLLLTMQLKTLYLANYTPTLPKLRWAQFGVHLICVGLAIALSMRRFSSSTETNPA